MTTHTIKHITLNESERAAETLANAFYNDALIRWLIGQTDDYFNTAKALFKTWINYAVRYGIALRTENFEAIALRLKPGQTKMTMWKMLRAGMFKTPRIIGKEGLNRIQILEKAIEKAQKENIPDNNFMYCWVLGTDPLQQKKGFGGALVQATFDMAAKLAVPCYLETATGGPSESVHGKFGYKAKSIIPISHADFTLTAMIKGSSAS